jgi:hypothetical protein
MGEQMMKKILMLLLVSFLFFGCTADEPEITEEDENIVYGTYLSWEHYEPVVILNSIFLTNLDDLHDFELKSAVFDPILSETLDYNMINTNSSEGSINGGYDVDAHTYTLNRFLKLTDQRIYVESYTVENFSAYLTTSFHENMQRLEKNEITADDMFETYGTHVIMSVRSGYEIKIVLTIEGRDVTPEERDVIINHMFNHNPITFPITDPNYLLLEAKARITLDIKTSQQSESISQILNDLNAMTMPFNNRFTQDDIIPLHRLFGWDESQYPNAINLLRTRYMELFPTE